jgi:peptidoglycan/LPS O-acetylase OafA/YrhL
VHDQHGPVSRIVAGTAWYRKIKLPIIRPAVVVGSPRGKDERTAMRQTDHWRVPALDGLRGIAVLTVLLYHAPIFGLVGGNIGVDLFFVLSGFLITSILLNEWRARGTISISLFYLRRALRLFPAAFLVLLFAMIFARFVQPSSELEGSGKDALAVLFYVFNWRLEWLYSNEIGNSHNHMLSHFWSLSVEEQFYLIWPGLLLTLLRLKASKPLMLAFFAAGILAPAAGRLMLWHAGPSLELYFRTDLRVDALMWGAMLAWLAHNEMISADVRLRRFAGLAGFAALCAFFYMAKYELLSGGFFYRWGFLLVGLSSVLMIWCATAMPASIFSRCLSIGWLRWTGRISYGLYLWHVPVFILCGALQVGGVLGFSLGAFLTILIAAVSYEFFEMPFLRLKKRFGYAKEGHTVNRNCSLLLLCSGFWLSGRPKREIR